jgi:hypothetical protein
MTEFRAIFTWSATFCLPDPTNPQMSGCQVVELKLANQAVAEHRTMLDTGY